MTDLPAAPYYAVIFRSELSADTTGYAAAAERMETLASQQPGYLGICSVRDGSIGVTISYWQSAADIAHWRTQTEHLLAQQTGRDRWYAQYTVEVSRVERCYGFASDN